MSQGRRPYPQDPFGFYEFDQGKVAKGELSNFSQLLELGFDLSEEEHCAYQWLQGNLQISPEERLELFTTAMDTKAAIQFGTKRERRFYLPRGPRAFLLALERIVAKLPGFRIYRARRFDETAKIRFLELGNKPTEHQKEVILGSLAQIEPADLANELSFDTVSLRYLVSGNFTYFDWAVVWYGLYKGEFVAPTRLGSIWETFSQYFMENVAGVFDLRKPRSLSAQMSRFNSAFPTLLPRVVTDIVVRERVQEYISQLKADYPVTAVPEDARTRVDVLVKSFANSLLSVRWKTLPRPRFRPLSRRAGCGNCGLSDIPVCDRVVGLVDPYQKRRASSKVARYLCFECFERFVDDQYSALGW